MDQYLQITMNNPIRVTFDSNVLQLALRPFEEEVFGAPSLWVQQTIHKALAEGWIKGFVSKTYFTKEATTKEAREQILRRTFRRYAPVGISSVTRETSTQVVTRRRAKQPDEPRKTMFRPEILALMRQYHVQILPTFLLGDVGTCSSKVKGDFRVDDIPFGDDLRIEDPSVLARNNECFRFITETMGAGVLSVDWLDSKDGTKVGKEADRALAFRNPSSEESDVQAICTHYAHQLDIFCTEDQGKSEGSNNSVMKPENKKMLAEQFGIQFCTMSELASIICDRQDDMVMK